MCSSRLGSEGQVQGQRLWPKECLPRVSRWPRGAAEELVVLRGNLRGGRAATSEHSGRGGVLP